MSDILIKGMEMPKRCLDCPFMVSRDNDDCVLQTEVKNELARTWEELKASCPLVEIPTPHGDLVDRNELLAEYDRQHEGEAGKARKIMEQAKTVIEAEGREKECF